jgi:hypothetical protein
MTAGEFKIWALQLEAQGLLERNGFRNGEIVWRLTEAGLRDGFPPVPVSISSRGMRRRMGPSRRRP